MSLRAIDFSRPPERIPRLGMVLLAVGLASLLIVAVLQQRWASEREFAHQEAERRFQALRAEQESRATPRMPTADAVRMKHAEVERRRPWLGALRAVEAVTRDPVFLMSLNADAGNESFRLEGEAPSFEHALAYVQQLPDMRGLISAQLLSHEQVTDSASGRQVVKFSASARWGAP
jgi:hypothetical protein